MEAMSGVTVPTIIASTSARSTPKRSTMSLVAATAKSLAATPGSARCRSRIPVRSMIHSLVVSTIFPSSLLVRTRGGT